MDAQRIEDITEWDARSFSDGFAGLRRLADRGFSGAATDGTGWLFMLNGRVVGVVDADLDAFEDASGTIYRAPHEELPLLFAMLEEGGTKRAQYYTNDTPLSEADRKLSGSGFTGYVELAENVLSGDYYLTYTGDESRAAAYVGNSRRLETGDDAFALADDEVGIYTVYEVDLDVRGIPEPDDEPTSDGAIGDSEEDDGSEGDNESREGDGSEGDELSEGSNADVDSDDVATADIEDVDVADAEKVADSDDGSADSDDGSAGRDDRSADRDDRSADRDDRSAENDDIGDVDPETVADDEADDTVVTAGVGNGAETADGGEEDDEAAGSTIDGVESPSGASNANARPSAEERRANDDDVFSEEEEWREARSIPALDPKEASERSGRERSRGEDGSRSDGSRSDGLRSAEVGPRSGAADSEDGVASGTRGPSQSGSRRDNPKATNDAASPKPRTSGGTTRSAVSERASVQQNRLQREVQRLESDLEAALSERDAAAAERDEIAAELDEHASERERLASEVEELREERDRLRERLSEVEAELPSAERSIPAARARGETNLFIRYDSKGDATLEDAHEGLVDREALRGNIRIEHHTGFESEGAVVDGTPFEEFLRGTMEYGFTRWLVEDLPFEIQDTGNEGALRDLYDALPKVDRAEIDGSVSVVTRENGEEIREQRAFDLVLRDRMGNPLFIADLNDSREPTEEGTLESLVANGGDIAESNDSFAAAFAVTASFFEPASLETASAAVGGGLLNRSKRSSFVKLSRKRGYHLCLVESREGGFHLTVPDL